MADQRKKGGEKDGGGHEPPKPTPKPRPNEHGTTPPQIHRDYIQRQVGGGGRATADTVGGGAATADAYRRATTQWHQLPGAVRVSPSEVEAPEPPAPVKPPQEKNEHDETTTKE